MAPSLIFALLFLLSCASSDTMMGVNFGRVADNILPPTDAVALMKKLGFGMVKIFDADKDVLEALSGSNLKVSIMVPNQKISEVASSQAVADSWVHDNVLAYYPATDIDNILVGNEILSDSSLRQTTWPQLVPAMENMFEALTKANLSEIIKVSTPLASDVLSSTYPPSSAVFRSDIAVSVVQPLLDFLSRTDSIYFTNVYPFFPAASNAAQISLDYALFGSSSVVVQDGSYGYNNLFDAMVDATVAAIEKLGYRTLKIGVSETGWPNGGNALATASNAAMYNKRLVKRTLAAVGTPRRAHQSIPTYIFALFNENLKSGAAVEPYWGVTYPNGKPVYSLTDDGEGDTAGEAWCVAKTDVETQSLQAGLNYACSVGADCSDIQPGGICYYPNTVAAHASYAFNSYWQKQKTVGGSCSFQGAAVVTHVNPSYGSCIFPSST